MRHFTELEKKIVLENLKNKIPVSRFLRDVLHVGNRTFDRMCSEIGIKYPRFRKNKIWDNPFTNIQDKNVQYWLGWLATDGYISDTDYKCSLFLSDKDRDVIEKFNTFLGGTLTIHTVIHHGKYLQTGIKFRNERIVKFLNDLGYNSRKTFEFYPKFDISWNYIRGCFEGDGYIRKGEIDIVGASKKHIELIYNFIKQYDINVKFRTRLDKSGNELHHIGIHSLSDIQKFVDYLYKDADVFMNRKYLNARAASNSSWKALKFGEPASGIPSQASIQEEGVTTLQEPPNRLC